MSGRNDINKLVSFLEKQLPDMFLRADITKLTHGIINRKTVQNHEYLGDGPKSYRFGSKICYDKSEFIEWAKVFFDRSSNNGRVEGLSTAADTSSVQAVGFGAAGRRTPEWTREGLGESDTGSDVR